MLDWYFDLLANFALLAKSYAKRVERAGHIGVDVVDCWFTNESSTKKDTGGKGAGRNLITNHRCSVTLNGLPFP